MIDLLWTHVWWRYPVQPGWESRLYHGFNLVEGAAWFLFSMLVFARWIRHRKSAAELGYALAFLTFGLTDFVEAWISTSGLLWLKLLNLAVLFSFRRHALRRWYPGSHLF